MDDTINLMAYQPALLASLILVLAILIQSALTAPLAFLKQEQAPGMPLTGNHSRLSFRVLRTYLNSVENLPAFGLALVLAIVLSGSPIWVNGLVIAHVGFRLAFWGVYYSGAGKIAGGPRTLCYVGGLMSNLGLVVVSFISLLTLPQ